VETQVLRAGDPMGIGLAWVDKLKYYILLLLLFSLCYYYPTVRPEWELEWAEEPRNYITPRCRNCVYTR